MGALIFGLLLSRALKIVQIPRDEASLALARREIVKWS